MTLFSWFLTGLGVEAVAMAGWFVLKTRDRAMETRDEYWTNFALMPFVQVEGFRADGQFAYSCSYMLNALYGTGAELRVSGGPDIHIPTGGWVEIFAETTEVECDT